MTQIEKLEKLHACIGLRNDLRKELKKINHDEEIAMAWGNVEDLDLINTRRVTWLGIWEDVETAMRDCNL